MERNFIKGSLRYVSLFLLLLGLCTLEDAGGQIFRASEERLADRAMRRAGDISELFEGWRHVGDMQVDSIQVNRNDKVLSVYFNPSITHIPIRHLWLEGLRSGLASRLGFGFRDYDLQLYARGLQLEEYIPNFYRPTAVEPDSGRIMHVRQERRLVEKEGARDYRGGLSGSHIALWPSHGYYYEAQRDRWEWQRARLYGTIEDLFTFAFIQPYLVPMLENAGAYVFLPRERDLQHNEVIVGKGGSSGHSEILITDGDLNEWSVAEGGFALRDTLFDGDNPFLMGTHLRIRASEDQGAAVSYIPDIPEDGEYAVYISWVAIPGNISDVRYTVNHSGGTQVFIVDQTMGSGTWIYLGTYFFYKGMHGDNGSVVLSGDSSEEGFVTADAVRFGGGTGNVARRAPDEYESRQWSLHDGNKTEKGTAPDCLSGDSRWKLSGRPRYMEGARYYLQYSGMPDSSVYSITRGKNDYNDDFMSRGEWVNFLMGAPMGVTGAPAPDNLGLPVDMVLAFHTDAGVTQNDSVIGTLAIYSSDRDNGVFHSGQSRLASRDLSDIIQTLIVDDIRLQFDSRWIRRGLWDRQYSEAWRPHAPAMLLELLSHQNLADMSYGLDPRFRFIVSRAIYKGMLQYLARNQGRDAIVQPLPPVGMALERVGDALVRLSWEAREDPGEPTASAKSFRVYTRTENGGFDSGVRVSNSHLDIRLSQKEAIYSFKVTAVNEGGESMPGEILSVWLNEKDDKPVLVVNAFTRLSGPSVFDRGDIAGIQWWSDRGVPDKYDFSLTGAQYDFSRMSKWLDDDSPGWGASYADMEGKIIPGNSFDFPALYGRTLRDAGYSFISTGRDAFETIDIDPQNYSALIVIFGEQRGTPRWNDPGITDFRVFSPGMISALKNFAHKGTGIMVSGSYLGTDMVESNDSSAIDFARDYLGFTWRTNHASNTGGVTATVQCPLLFPRQLHFNALYDRQIYTVVAPDAIEAAGDDAVVSYRYDSNAASAGILKTGNNRVVALGFPFETILCADLRIEMITGIMNFFLNDSF